MGTNITYETDTSLEISIQSEQNDQSTDVYANKYYTKKTLNEYTSVLFKLFNKTCTLAQTIEPSSPCIMNSLWKIIDNRTIVFGGEYNTSTDDTLDFTTIMSIYDIRNQAEVFEFLNKYSYLLPILIQANFEIWKYFAVKRNILELISDPEFDEKYLSVFIQTKLSPKDAFLKLKEFDKKWWNNVSPEAGGKIDINVEFI
ncbi:MAG: hypothetical protein PHX56_09045 [Atribacterota bacterium]|nr:hypothetical protein [Atribacterota bacterium]MDD4363658.1 hypothetical protein [Atribacterota bacterium]